MLIWFMLTSNFMYFVKSLTQGTRGSVDLGGIHSNADYTITVKAVNHYGASQPSAPATITTSGNGNDIRNDLDNSFTHATHTSAS